MKKRIGFISLLAGLTLLGSCGSPASNSTENLASTAGSTQTSTPNEEQVGEEVILKGSAESAADIADALETIANAERFGLRYTYLDREYLDVYSNNYVTVDFQNSGYVLLPAVNPNEMKGDEVLYTYSYDGETPILNLPVTNYDGVSLAVAHSLDDVNYIKKLLAGNIGYKRQDFFTNTDHYYSSTDSTFVGIFKSLLHNGSANVTSVRLYLLDSTLSFDLLSSSGTVLDSGSFDFIGSAASEAAYNALSQLSIPTHHLSYSSLDNIKDNIFTSTSKFTRVYEDGQTVDGVGIKIYKDQTNIVSEQYAASGKQTSAYHFINKEGKVYETGLDGLLKTQEVPTTDSSSDIPYDWNDYVYDSGSYLDPLSFRATDENSLTYEYYGVQSYFIVASFLYVSDFSSYGNIRNIKATLDPATKKLASLKVIFTDSYDENRLQRFHNELDISFAIEDEKVPELPTYTESDADLASALSLLDGTHKYKATATVESSEQLTTYYYDDTSKALVSEAKGSSTSETEISGQKYFDNEGISKFIYYSSDKVAQPVSGDVSKTLEDLALIHFDPKAFQKESDGSYVLRPYVNFPTSSINIEGIYLYPSNPGVRITLNDKKQIGSIEFNIPTALANTSIIVPLKETIVFDFENPAMSQGTKTIVDSVQKFVAPSSWKDYSIVVYNALNQLKAGLGDTFPLLYDSRILEWTATYYPEETDPSFPWPAYVSFKSTSNDIATNQDYLKMYRAFFSTWTYDNKTGYDKYTKDGVSIQFDSDSALTFTVTLA